MRFPFSVPPILSVESPPRRMSRSIAPTGGEMRQSTYGRCFLPPLPRRFAPACRSWTTSFVAIFSKTLFLLAQRCGDQAQCGSIATGTRECAKTSPASTQSGKERVTPVASSRRRSTASARPAPSFAHSRRFPENSFAPQSLGWELRVVKQQRREKTPAFVSKSYLGRAANYLLAVLSWWTSSKSRLATSRIWGSASTSKQLARQRQVV